MWKSHQSLVSLLWELPRLTVGTATETTNSVQSVWLDPHLLCTICLWPLSLLWFEDWALSSDRWVAPLNTSCGPPGHRTLTPGAVCSWSRGVNRHWRMIPDKTKILWLSWFWARLGFKKSTIQFCHITRASEMGPLNATKHTLKGNPP